MEYIEFDCGCRLPKLGEKKRSDGEYQTRVDYYNINLDCPRTWEILKEGNTIGVFQLESRLGQGWSNKVQPQSIFEVSDLISLLRPGCLHTELDGKNMSQHYVDRKFLKEENTVKYEPLRPIFERTQGVLIYQEQIMRIGKDLAGFTLGEVEDLRKAVGSKNSQKLLEVQKKFIERAKEYGVVSEEAAKEIFGWVMASGRYAFCLNHGVAYSFGTYWSAYMKAHFPKRFSQSYLIFAKDKATKSQKECIKEIIQDSKKQGIYVKKPTLLNIFINEGKFCMVDGELYYGIASIKDIGESALKKLSEVIYNFKPVEDMDWADILFYLSPKINVKCMEALIKSGALDYLEIPRKRMLFELHELKLYKDAKNTKFDWFIDNYTDSLYDTLNKALSLDDKPFNTKLIKEKLKKSLDNLRNPPYNLEEDTNFNLRHEREFLGVVMSDINSPNYEHLCNCSCLAAKDIPRKNMIMLCTIQECSFFKIKKGNNAGKSMCSMTLADDYGMVDAVAWSDTLEDYEHLMYEDNVVVAFCDPSTSRKNQVTVKKLCQA